jgi:hypothetical protein
VPNFLLVATDDEGPTLYNLDHIIVVSEIRPAHCLIRFVHNTTLELNGAGADTFVKDLYSEAHLANGMSVPEMLEKNKQLRDSGQSEVIPFRGPEPRK